MAGKGAKFTLKSGNKPTFKGMGSSPAKISGVGTLITGAKGGFTPDIDYSPEEEKSDSPNNLNNFGIGPGGSPWKQGETETDAERITRLEKEKADREVTYGKDKKPGKGAKVGEKKESNWMKALKIGTTLLSGGIQGVYGGTRHQPKVNWGKWTKEELDEPAASNIENPHEEGTEAWKAWEETNKEE